MEKKIWYACIPCYEVFFDQDGKLITYVHENDASFREEYQAALFNHFGIKVEAFNIPENVYNTIDEQIGNGEDAEDVIEKYVRPSLESIVKKQGNNKA